MIKQLLTKSRILCAVLGTGIIMSSGNANAQLIDGHAYMIGDYVEIGVSSDGHEGAPCTDEIDLHCTSPVLLGFVANPAMDGWIEINGDFFAMGMPESGFGLTYTLLGDTYERSNNATIAVDDLVGAITSFSDTPDSIIVIWQGGADDLLLTITYELKKDQHYYTTSMTLDNMGTETFTDVYYYRNLDPDNNQSSGGSYSTTNEIIKQSGMEDDSVIVRASQTLPWSSDLYFHAYGADWKGFYGGFANRNGDDIWNAAGGLIQTEGSSTHGDLACGLAYKIESLPPGKATSDVFSFATAFKAGIVFAEDEPDTGTLDEAGAIDFSIYPNPATNNSVDVKIEGTFNYSIVDLKGSQVLNGSGNGNTEIDLSAIEKGIYLIQIQQEEKSAVEKLILR